MIFGVSTFTNRIDPFFQQYPLPNCKKKEIFDRVAEAANCLTKLKQKQTNKQIWTNTDWNNLDKVIHATWDLNPSGKDRKFTNPKMYLQHLKLCYEKNQLKIR
jgi:hypothetical protein